MNIQRLKTPPMVIGLFLAGLLLFAVVGIARKATGATVADAMQNSIVGAVARPVMPQVALPAQQVVVIVVTATPTRPPYYWLDVAVDVTGAWWVWGDSAWIACGRIAANLTYSIDQSEPSWSAWYWLHANQRQAVYNRCLEVTR
jgi:xanthine/uracil/vitamin C permease (AzgA family)